MRPHVPDAGVFAWRRGRLQVRDATILALRERVQQWFGVDVRIASPRAASERISLHVPLASADSLIAALALLGDGKIERSGTEITVGVAPGREASAPVAPAETGVARGANRALAEDSGDSEDPRRCPAADDSGALIDPARAWLGLCVPRRRHRRSRVTRPNPAPNGPKGTPVRGEAGKRGQYPAP